jgi:hypothetical protein
MPTRTAVESAKDKSESLGGDMRLVGRIMFIAGLGALLLGGFDVTLLLRGTRTPEVTTAEALGAADGTNNVHLTVTRFRFGTVLIEKDDHGKWNRVWLPVLSPDGQWTPRPIVAHTRQVKSQEELSQLLKQEEITGVVSNGMQGLGRNQQQQFAVHYPNANLSGAIALEIGRRFPSPLVAYPVAIVGLVAFVVGIGLSFGIIGKDRGTNQPAAVSPAPE